MIVVTQSGVLKNLPPLISLLQLLKHKGEDVVYVGFIEDASTRQILAELGLEFALYDYPLVAFKDRPLLNVWQKLTNFIRPYLMRTWAWRVIGNKCQGNPEVIIWSADMRASAILGNHARMYGKRFIQTLYELGEEVGKSYLRFDIERLYHEATVVECEYNRAHILKAEHDIEDLPFVMPNKPFAHPRKKDLSCSEVPGLKSILESWKDKRVFLYQGVLQDDRQELFAMIDALCAGLPDCVIAVMGKSNSSVESLSRKYKNFCHVPFVLPPKHLVVTSYADIGLAYYKGGAIYGLSPLNPVYCAPNKIFEYAGFGIPMICNDVPGLKYSVGDAGAAICLNSLDRQSVVDAAKKILADYETYSHAAVSYFDSVNVEQISMDILNHARGVKPL